MADQKVNGQYLEKGIYLKLNHCLMVLEIHTIHI